MTKIPWRVTALDLHVGRSCGEQQEYVTPVLAYCPPTEGSLCAAVVSQFLQSVRSALMVHYN